MTVHPQSITEFAGDAVCTADGIAPDRVVAVDLDVERIAPCGIHERDPKTFGGRRRGGAVASDLRPAKRLAEAALDLACAMRADIVLTMSEIPRAYIDT